MKKLDKKMLDVIESKIKINGLENTLDKMYSILEETKLRKEQLLQRNSPLHNTDSQIQGCLDVIDYLTEKLIERNIKKLLAGK